MKRKIGDTRRKIRGLYSIFFQKKKKLKVRIFHEIVDCCMTVVIVNQIVS